MQIEVPEYVDDQGLIYEESSLDDGDGGNGKMPFCDKRSSAQLSKRHKRSRSETLRDRESVIPPETEV